MSRDDGRDDNGRWKKGHCPNPKGRPRKEIEYSEADYYIFKNTMVTANINGVPTRLSRHALLMHSNYDQAIKGKSPTLANSMLQRFEKSDETIEEAKTFLQGLGREIIEYYRETGELPEKRLQLYKDIYKALNGRDFEEEVAASAPPRDYSNWRRGPKPQCLLDEEQEWEDAEKEWEDEE